jgi:DNA-directed RNA polymerase subunit RPC12/RpoP
LPLKVLIAGCAEAERQRLESLVRSVIGDRARQGTWNVSLVRIGGKHSLRLDGPHESLRAVSFIVAESELRQQLLDALSRAGLASPGTPAQEPLPPPGDTRRDVYDCGSCGKGFAVLYEGHPQDPRRRVPVACPHCWQINHVEVSQWAATGEEYRAEKA